MEQLWVRMGGFARDYVRDREKQFVYVFGSREEAYL